MHFRNCQSKNKSQVSLTKSNTMVPHLLAPPSYLKCRRCSVPRSETNRTNVVLYVHSIHCLQPENHAREHLASRDQERYLFYGDAANVLCSPRWPKRKGYVGHDYGAEGGIDATSPRKYSGGVPRRHHYFNFCHCLSCYVCSGA